MTIAPHPSIRTRKGINQTMQTVLWDLDGTLADTEELHFQAWQQTLARYGVAHDRAAFLAGFGRSNRSILSEMFGVTPDAPIVAEIAAAKESTVRSLLGATELALLPGVATWLDTFAAARMRQVISSSGPMANIAAMVSKLGIGDYFVSLMSGATLPRGKPHPDLFLNSAAAVGVAPEACVVIEDSIHGVEAARRAGMRCVVVGKLAADSDLAARVAPTPGPPILAAPSLADLTWPVPDALWRA